jgi:hypothetical protein
MSATVSEIFCFLDKSFELCGWSRCDFFSAMFGFRHIGSLSITLVAVS